MSRLSKSNLLNSNNDLCRRVKQRDIKSFELLYDSYSSALYSLIINMIGDPFTSNAILKQVFDRAWRTIGQFDENKTALFSWMLNIARTEALNVENQGSNAYSNDIEQRENFQQVTGFKQLIDQLPDDCRTILSLSYFGGMADERIADRLQLPVSGIKKFKKRGLLIVHRMISEKDRIKKPSPISERVLASQKGSGASVSEN